MGVKATLAGVALTAGDITQAETLGIDAKGLMVVAQAKCDDLKQLLSVLADLPTDHSHEPARHGAAGLPTSTTR